MQLVSSAKDTGVRNLLGTLHEIVAPHGDIWVVSPLRPLPCVGSASLTSLVENGNLAAKLWIVRVLFCPFLAASLVDSRMTLSMSAVEHCVSWTLVTGGRTKCRQELSHQCDASRCTPLAVQEAVDHRLAARHHPR